MFTKDIICPVDEKRDKMVETPFQFQTVKPLEHESNVSFSSQNSLVLVSRGTHINASNGWRIAVLL